MFWIFLAKKQNKRQNAEIEKLKFWGFFFVLSRSATKPNIASTLKWLLAYAEFEILTNNYVIIFKVGLNVEYKSK